MASEGLLGPPPRQLSYGPHLPLHWMLRSCSLVSHSTQLAADAPRQLLCLWPAVGSSHQGPRGSQRWASAPSLFLCLLCLLSVPQTCLWPFTCFPPSCHPLNGFLLLLPPEHRVHLSSLGDGPAHGHYSAALHQGAVLHPYVTPITSWHLYSPPAHLTYPLTSVSPA